MPALVSPQSEVWETSAEIPCVWYVTTQNMGVGIWLDEANFPRGMTNQKPHPNLGSDRLFDSVAFLLKHMSETEILLSILQVPLHDIWTSF